MGGSLERGRRHLHGEGQSGVRSERGGCQFLRAWRLYYFGQWPAPTSAGKLASYQRAIKAYLLHARYFDPPLEVVRIPFEGSEIVGYLRLPANAPRPVPLVLAISGLDSRKETVAETYAAALSQGIGFFSVDSPGTGQAPLKAGETSERMYSRVLDYLVTRQDIDAGRILVHGQSFGAYWAAKLAHTEAKRLVGAVTQSPPIHRTFQQDFFRGRMYTREYLFDCCRRASTSTACTRLMICSASCRRCRCKRRDCLANLRRRSSWLAARAIRKCQSTTSNS